MVPVDTQMFISPQMSLILENVTGRHADDSEMGVL